MFSVDEYINQLERQYETYWDKLSRISKSPDSRICRTDHHGFADTTYVLILNDGELHKIRVETMNQMEYHKETK